MYFEPREKIINSSENVNIHTLMMMVMVKVAQSGRIFVTAWTVAHKAPLSMKFSRPEYWSGYLFPSPGDLPNPGMDPGLLHCRQILYHLGHQGSSDILIWVHDKANFKKQKKMSLKSEKTIFIWKGLLSVVLSSQERRLFWGQSVQDV